MKDATIQVKQTPGISTKVGEKLKQLVPSRRGLGSMAKGVSISLASMALFLLLWHAGASYLFNIEASAKIEKAMSEQGAAAAAEMEACINSGDVSCQPNTLPSPAQVWAAAGALLADHQIISQKKTDFAIKVSATNAQRKAQGLAAIQYTGRPSFIDQIFTSLKTVLVG
ncbi:MAG: ABC transporter permease, partial [Bacteroidota bacterium]